MKIIRKALFILEHNFIQDTEDLYFTIIHYLSNIYIHEQKYDEAEEYINEGIKYYERKNLENEDYFSFLMQKGIVLFSKKFYHESLNIFLDLYSRGKSHLHHNELIDLTFLIAQIYNEIDDYNNAKSYYMNVLELFYKILKEGLSPL